MHCFTTSPTSIWMQIEKFSCVLHRRRVRHSLKFVRYSSFCRTLIKRHSDISLNLPKELKIFTVYFFRIWPQIRTKVHAHLAAQVSHEMLGYAYRMRRFPRERTLREIFQNFFSIGEHAFQLKMICSPRCKYVFYIKKIQFVEWKFDRLKRVWPLAYTRYVYLEKIP